MYAARQLAAPSANGCAVSGYDSGMRAQRYSLLRGLRSLLITVAVIAIGGWTPSFAFGDDARPQQLTAASSADHLWFVSDAIQLNDRRVLCHHARAMPGPYLSRTMPLSRQPRRMAAVGRQIWIVFPQSDDDESPRRNVYTLQIEHEEAIDLYRPSPRNRLRIVEALPAGGELAGVVGTREGPVALLREHEPATDAEANGAQLLVLQSAQWTELELPHELAAGQPMRLGVAGAGLDRLHLLVADPDAPEQAIQYIRDADGDWSKHTLPLDLNRVRALATADGRLAAAVRDTDGDSSIRLCYIRPGRVLPLARLPAPSEPWTLLGMQDGFRTINASASGDVAIQHIDPVTGAVGATEPMRDQPLPAARLWHMTLMLTIAVLAVLTVLLTRPTAQEQVKLPDDVAPASVGARGTALLIDLLPGALAAVFVLRAPPNTLLHLPILTTSFNDAAPHLVMIGVALAHGTLTELFSRSTLGKALLGIRITTANGDAPSLGQIMLRNMLKGMTLLIPPLAVFLLLNPYMQGVHDLLARTFVVQPRPADAAQPSEGDDRDGS